VAQVTAAGVGEIIAAQAALAPLVAGLAAGLLAAAETFVFLSLFIPATAVLMAAGAMVATGAFAFLPIWAGAAAGAVLGSTVSWWIGRRWGHRVLGLWPLRDRPALVAATRAQFARRGGAAVLLGHFVGAVRPVVFLFAGISGMGFWRFQLWNLAGAVIWAFVIPKTGEIGGDFIGWLRLALGF
jgi:membrane protein DedA with SNARE-associated domain